MEFTRWNKELGVKRKVYSCSLTVTDDSVVIPFELGYIGQITIFPGTSYDILYTVVPNPDLTTPADQWISIQSGVTGSQSFPLDIFVTGVKIVATGACDVYGHKSNDI